MNRDRNMLSLSAIKKIVFRFLVIVLLFACEKFEPERIIKVETGSVANISYTSCSIQGTIIDTGGNEIDQHGFCWSVTKYPTTANNKTQLGSKSSTGNFSGSLTGLSAGTTYYVWAYATSSAGTAYGNEVSFTTLDSSSSVTDYDGNLYQTITIGTQTWMAENLKTTKYNNGEAIPLVTDETQWSNLTTPGYCWYKNDEASYKNTYGALYNWHTVNTGRLCPTDWHVPTNAEWTTLTDFLGGGSVAAGKLKEAGTTHWDSPNTGATNESGFTALPGGSRNFDGIFSYVGYYGNWWSSTEYLSTSAWGWFLNYFSNNAGEGHLTKEHGFSVRCVRDY